LRTSIEHKTPLTPTGKTAWRALVKPDALPEELRGPWTGLWMAPNAHLVHYPVRAGKLINVVAVIEERWAKKEERWTCDADANTLTAIFEKWDPRIAGIVAAADDWRKWTLYDMPPLKRWMKGTALLVGDAAHPVPPFLAQGGALAIEDAVVLARTLERCNGDVWDGFVEYEKVRIERTARMRYESRKMGNIYHMGGLSRRVRNFLLSRSSEEKLLQNFDWIYSFNALA
jgi:salicylate hydroxylase